jgi:hypothetical protein
LLLTRKLLTIGFLFVNLKSSLRTFNSRHHDLVNRYEISFTYDHIYSTCRKHYRSFSYSWLATGFVTKVIRRVSLVEQKMLTIPKHLCSPLVFSEFRVARSLLFCVLFCRSPFVLFLLVIKLSVLRLTGFCIFKLLYVYWWGVCEIRFSYPFWHFHISLHTKHM